MRSRVTRGIRTRLHRLGGQRKRSSSDVGSRTINSPSEICRPVDDFYSRLIKKNLTAFSAFALQSRSLFIRDIFAREASSGRHNASTLLSEIDELLHLGLEDPAVFARVEYNPQILLSFANYLLDTARTDLDTEAGLQILRLSLHKFGDDALTDHHKLQFVEAAATLRHYAEQKDLVDRFDLENLAPKQAELIEVNRIAKEVGSPSEWVEAMNRLYAAWSMTQITLDHDASLPLLDRLTSTNESNIRGPKVSIIMPTYSPNAGIFTALGSLLRQTWSNTEIIVVDDGSPEAFDEILSKVEHLDPRIRVIRQKENGGAYVARNAGLAEACGVYVTTHDDDDWSHPDKIATQASVLMNDDSVTAITVGHIRTTQDMQFRRINAKPRHLQTNYSSLMFRKSAIDEIGGWDVSNRGSDTELAGRITQNFGKASVVHLADKPMSFSRVWDGSLTAGEIYRGYFAYSRLLYRWSFRQWHRDAKKSGQKPKLDPAQRRPFAVPTSFEPNNRNKDLGLFDVIYVTDFSKHSRFVGKVLHEIESAIESGYRVGYLHLNSPQTLKRAEIPAELFELQLEKKITQVADSDQAEAKLMVVYDASIGMFLDQFRSSVVVRQGIVVEDKGAFLQGSAHREASHPRIAVAHLDKSFNTYFRMVGAAHKDHESIREQLPPDRVLPDEFIWNTHIDTEPSVIRKPRKKPVVGFHSFGNKYRWPSSRETFDAVYSYDTITTYFFGALKPLKSELGKDIISADQELKSSSYSLQDFFERIDFWVYFPHERLEDRSWSAVLEALQAGKVVILPHHLQPIYGDGALYARPEEVVELIREYSQDASKYEAQAKLGQERVAMLFSRKAYALRLKQLMQSK